MAGKPDNVASAQSGRRAASVSQYYRIWDNAGNRNTSVVVAAGSEYQPWSVSLCLVHEYANGLPEIGQAIRW